MAILTREYFPGCKIDKPSGDSVYVYALATTSSALYLVRLPGNPLSAIPWVIAAFANDAQSRKNWRTVENARDIVDLLKASVKVYYRFPPESFDDMLDLKKHRIKLRNAKGKKIVRLHLKRKEFPGLLGAIDNLKGKQQ